MSEKAKDVIHTKNHSNDKLMLLNETAELFIMKKRKACVVMSEDTRNHLRKSLPKEHVLHWAVDVALDEARKLLSQRRVQQGVNSSSCSSSHGHTSDGSYDSDCENKAREEL